MPRNILSACFLVLFITVISCSQMDSNKFLLPSEYTHAKGMLDALNKHGLKIQEIKNSNYMALFETKPNYAMFIKTDLGVVDIIHLDEKNGDEFTIGNKASTDERFIYTITKKGKDAQLVDSNAETYFNKNDEYISMTREKQLNEKLKELFK